MPAGDIYALSFAKQTAQGAAAAAAVFRSGLTGGSLGINRVTNAIDETAPTAQRLAVGSYLSQVTAGGTPEFAARPSLLGLLLYGALGAKSVTGAADPYTHLFTPAGTQPYLTFWRQLGAIIFDQFTDCKVSQLVLTSTSGGFVKATATVLGLSPTSDSTDSQSAVTLAIEDPLFHADLSGAFLVDGVPVSCITGATVTINNNGSIVQGDSLGGCTINTGKLDITVEAQHTVLDAALYNLFHYGSASPADNTPPTTGIYSPAAGLDLKWTRVAAAPGPERSLELVAPRVQLQTLAGYEPNTGGDPLSDTQTYKVYQPLSGAGLTASLLNAVASY